MAGGQERILRGRIRSDPGDEEDHARHGADRGVADRQGAAARARRRAVLGEDHRGRARPRRRRGRPGTRRCSPGATRCARRPTSSSPPTAACAAATTPASQRAAEGEIKADVARRQAVPGRSRSAGRPRATSASAATSSARASRGSATTRPSPTPRRSAPTSSSSSRAVQVDKVELVYTRFITAGNQEVVLRPLVPLSVETVAGGDGRAPAPADAADRRLRVRARPDHDPRGAAAELRRGPHLRRPAQRRGVRARLHASGR